LAQDVANNKIFIYENSGRVRAVQSGTITTVVGSSSYGCCNDNGPSTNAMLRVGVGVAYHAGQNAIYVSDLYNNRIRKAIVGGNIVSITDVVFNCDSNNNKLATLSDLYSVRGISVDGNNILIAESKAQRTRLINKSTRIMTTLAGNGLIDSASYSGPAISNEMNNPYSMVATSNYYYISDYLNCRIARVAKSTGTMSSYLGDGTCGWAGDGYSGTSVRVSMYRKNIFLVIQ